MSINIRKYDLLPVRRDGQVGSGVLLGGFSSGGGGGGGTTGVTIEYVDGSLALRDTRISAINSSLNDSYDARSYFIPEVSLNDSYFKWVGGYLEPSVAGGGGDVTKVYVDGSLAIRDLRLNNIDISLNNTIDASGIQGAQGVQGTIGAQGTIGSQGLAGIQGAFGVQGTQGVQGRIGTQGTVGSQGLVGIQGGLGVQGTVGTQGTNGTQGTVGTQGLQGVQGKIGTQGTMGAQGTTGTFNVDQSLNIMSYVNSSTYYDGSLNARAIKILPDGSAGLSSPDSQGLYGTFTAGATIASRQLIYMQTNGRVAVADADASNMMPAIGINATSSSITSGNSGSFLIYGIYRHTTENFSVGKPVYCGLDGYMTSTRPTSAPDCVQVLGIAVSNDSILFNPSPDVIVLK